MVADVLSLLQISLAVCIKQAARITDVGDTPYHLIQPILKRLNAQQLALLEENSPIVTPHSDELWGALIEKDFPDRPRSQGKLRFLPSGENTQMPRKALYRQYASERELFLATSADRLRKMTEKLRREKLKNSITTVQGVIGGPATRRRVPQNYLSRKFNVTRTRPRSILGKAMRDVLHRLLIFGGPLKSYDPYHAFQGQNLSHDEHQKSEYGALSSRSMKSPSKSPARVSTHAPTGARQSPKKEMYNQDGQAVSNLPNLSDPPASTQTSSFETNQDVAKSHILSRGSSNKLDLKEEPSMTHLLRKRRLPPSIFLNQRKKQRSGATLTAPTTRNKRARAETEKEKLPEELMPIKAIKSSIFH